MLKKVNYKNILDDITSEIMNGIPAGTLLPTETELAMRYEVSRPTIAKVYNMLQKKGLVIKKPGIGTTVTYKGSHGVKRFGFLLPGAGESEIFGLISERFIELSQKCQFEYLWNGLSSGNAEIRQELTEKYCEEYIENKVTGVFFAPLERVPDAESFNQRICKRLTDANILVVLIDRDIVPYPMRSSYDIVSLDNFNASYLMAEHMINAGCSKLIFVHRPNSAESVKMRIYGTTCAAREHGIQFETTDICCGNPEDEAFIDRLPIIKGKTGIICANDSTAAVLMTTLGSKGIMITTDALLCAFDDMKYAGHLKYPLTSYRQPCIAIADAALELMYRRIENPDSSVHSINLLGEIIARESSAFK